MLDFYTFDSEKLLKLGETLADDYQNADPFPHIVVDDFLPDTEAKKLADAFPKSDFAGFKQPKHAFQQNKFGRLQDNYFSGVSPYLKNFLYELNSAVFLDFLERISGISGLIPDPHFNGGAVHQTRKGGKLGIHVDFSTDKRRQLERRLNVILYFNEDWKEEYGGHLELWSADRQKCFKKVLPILNRMAIFSTSNKSFHGHPDPLTCPDDRSRNSLALYYYTVGRPENYSQHTTLFYPKPGEAWPDGYHNKEPSMAREFLRRVRKAGSVLFSNG